MRGHPRGHQQIRSIWLLFCALQAHPPRSVLIVKKWRDEDARDAAVEIGDWLTDSFGCRVYVPVVRQPGVLSV